jgi:hypothetical protein
MNLAMGSVFQVTVYVVVNAFLKIKSGNAMVNVKALINLAMECAPLLEMCHTFKKVTLNVQKKKFVFC